MTPGLRAECEEILMRKGKIVVYLWRLQYGVVDLLNSSLATLDNHMQDYSPSGQVASGTRNSCLSNIAWRQELSTGSIGSSEIICCWGSGEWRYLTSTRQGFYSGGSYVLRHAPTVMIDCINHIGPGLAGLTASPVFNILPSDSSRQSGGTIRPNGRGCELWFPQTKPWRAMYANWRWKVHGLINLQGSLFPSLVREASCYARDGKSHESG
ncbi:hypothetical protein BDW42DRAFT_128313 [Aspergillus taichungensis]|uniref:Uncharacterized protein n=1 Tax=Aspergillus taichungensis TaxID=482145 RepID=A0A2J5HQ87_9EURO|nr:hypothetical protein BDW42DRAFT_128313 [Aspergillus taichungensis]